MTIGEKIKRLRTLKGLSQEELGKAINIHYTHISRYERNLSIPSIEVLKNISRFFEVSTDYLLFEDVEKMAFGNIQDGELLHQFEELDCLDDDIRENVKFILESVLAHQAVKHIATRTDKSPSRKISPHKERKKV